MTGPAGEDVELRSCVKSALGRSTCWPCLAEESIAVWLGDRCFTRHAPAANHDLPAAIRQQLAQSQWAVIAPMTARDARLVAKLVRAAPRAMLMLSRDQLAFSRPSLSLMSACDLTVATQAGMQQLTGLVDSRASMQWVWEHGVRNLAVIGRTGLMAIVDGDWHWQPSYTNSQERSSSPERR